MLCSWSHVFTSRGGVRALHITSSHRSGCRNELDLNSYLMKLRTINYKSGHRSGCVRRIQLLAHRLPSRTGWCCERGSLTEEHESQMRGNIICALFIIIKASLALGSVLMAGYTELSSGESDHLLHFFYFTESIIIIIANYFLSAWVANCGYF